jgi:hypothetical protein
MGLGLLEKKIRITFEVGRLGIAINPACGLEWSSGS